MSYIGTPLAVCETRNGLSITRNIEAQRAMLDNLIEFIVFTPRGSFNADSDFGLDYWNFEYSNSFYNNSLFKEKSEESIRKSLMAYVSTINAIQVSVIFDAAESEDQGKRKVFSKHKITILVEGQIKDGLGMMSPYRKEISFLVEPTSIRVK